MIDSHGAGRATEPAGSPEGYERRRLAAIPGSPRGSSGESQIEPVSLSRPVIPVPDWIFRDPGRLFRRNPLLACRKPSLG